MTIRVRRARHLPVEVRRNVTISVRFTGEEIDSLRTRAEASGEKVTSYIRAAALQQASPLDRRFSTSSWFGVQPSCQALASDCTTPSL